MDNQTYNQIVNFIWSIADDCLRDVYVRGKYRDVILPMVVIRRLDAVLEESKEEVLKTKKMLDEAGIQNQTEALCKTAKQSFCNSSQFLLKDLTSRAQQQKLKADFIAYLDGFSPNVQEILEKFKFRNQIDTMIEADILGAVIEKFVSPTINLSPYPIKNDVGEVKLPALDNHTMGLIFEELIRKFNEENNEEAGEHFTPRDVVELMADCIFMPVADLISDTTYTVYDGASGTGGMLTVAHDRLEKLAIDHEKKVSIHLFGQEINPETYAITKADMLLKGEGEEAEHIMFGSTLSNDGFPSNQFDFMLSNPPYGKAWKTDADKLGGKKDITDPRFVKSFKDEAEFSMIPRVSDGQMLFMLNNIAKMKENTVLGSRIAEVHNGSSLSTGDAGQGESNARRYIIENDLLECIIALPNGMFYNTPLGTFIWILSNKKESKRKGKIQLIDASYLKSPLKKNLGDRNCELTPELRKQILELYLNFEDNDHSKIFDNSEFGYWKVTVLQPEIDENGKAVLDKKGKPKADKNKTDTEKIPFTYKGGIDAYIRKEVLPFASNAWIDEKKTQIGYEIKIAKYFKKSMSDYDIEDLSESLAQIQKLLQNQVQIKSFHSHSNMTDVDEIWIDSIPSHWKFVKIKHLFDERIEKGFPLEPLLAATQNMGVVPKDVYGQKTVEATKDLHLLKLVKKDDFVISLRSFQGGIERAYYQGIISPAYTIMIPKHIEVEYFMYMAKSKIFIELLKQCVTGIREGQNIDYQTLKNIRIPLPPIEEQIKIAKYLGGIDAHIESRKKEIDILNQYKEAIVSDIVIGKSDILDTFTPTNEKNKRMEMINE